VFVVSDFGAVIARHSAGVAVIVSGDLCELERITTNVAVPFGWHVLAVH
jgi:hypothetical protein